MISKNADDKSKEIAALQARLQNHNEKQWQNIKEKLRILQAGIEGEKQVAYLIEFDYKDSDTISIIHDLRLNINGRTAQIDHLLIDHTLNVFVLESKHFSSGLKITDTGEFERWNDYRKRYEGMESPLAQNDRHIAVLKDAFQQMNMTSVSKKLQPTFHSYVLVSSKARIIRPKKEYFDSSNVIKADNIKYTIEKHTQEQTPTTPLFDIDRLTKEDLRTISEQLISLHEPTQADPHSYKPSSAPQNKPFAWESNADEKQQNSPPNNGSTTNPFTETAQKRTANKNTDKPPTQKPAQIYTIKATAGLNGTIFPSGSIPDTEGATRTFSFKPNPHHKVQSLMIDDNYLPYNSESYTFKNISSDHTIKVNFVRSPDKPEEEKVTTLKQPNTEKQLHPKKTLKAIAAFLFIMFTVGYLSSHIKKTRHTKTTINTDISRHYEYIVPSTPPPLQQETPPQNIIVQKQNETMGYQKTIQWWLQLMEDINKFNQWLKTSYTQIDQQVKQQNPNKNDIQNSPITAALFDKYLKSYYPNAKYNPACSCWTTQFSPTNTLLFTIKGVISIKWTEQQITKTATFTDPWGNAHYSYEITDGLNSLAFLIYTNNPTNSHFNKATMPEIALTANLLNDSRKTTHNKLPIYNNYYPKDAIAIILNDVYPTYIAKDNVSMAEFAEQLIADPNTRQKILALATELYK